MDGLIIKDPYAGWILAGEKIIELRGSNTTKRGTIAIIKSGTSKVYGTVELVDTFKIETREHYEALRLKHCVGAERKDIRYRNLWAWVLENPTIFKTPIEYMPKLGQQVWVKDVLKDGYSYASIQNK